MVTQVLLESSYNSSMMPNQTVPDAFDGSRLDSESTAQITLLIMLVLTSIATTITLRYKQKLPVEVLIFINIALHIFTGIYIYNIGRAMHTLSTVPPNHCAKHYSFEACSGLYGRGDYLVIAVFFVDL